MEWWRELSGVALLGLAGGVVSTGCDVAGCRYLAMHICEPHVRARSQEEHADLERQLAEAQQQADAIAHELDVTQDLKRDAEQRAEQAEAECERLIETDRCPERDINGECVAVNDAEQRAEEVEAERTRVQQDLMRLRLLVEPFVRKAHRAGHEDALITFRDVHLGDDQPYVWVSDLHAALASLPAAQEAK